MSRSTLNPEIDRGGQGAEIVRVELGELPRLHALLAWRRSGRPDQPASTSEPVDIGGLWIFAAEVEDRFAGYVSAVRVPKPDGRIYLYVDELWVAPPYRRQGLAEGLLRRVFDLARELDVWRVRLTVSADNPAARRLYSKLGFELEPNFFGEWRP